MGISVAIGLLAAIIFGSIGYVISMRFWKSAYAATNTRSNFGGPAGGVFFTMSGMMIGLLVMCAANRACNMGLISISRDYISAGIIGALSGGGLAGIISLLVSPSPRDRESK